MFRLEQHGYSSAWLDIVSGNSNEKIWLVCGGEAAASREQQEHVSVPGKKPTNGP